MKKATVTRDSRDRQLDMRRENCARVAEWLRDGGAATVAELAELTGLSKPTTQDRLLDLVETGLVRTAAPREDGTPGRPAARYEFAGDSAYVVGLDLAKDFEQLVFADLDGTVIAVERREIRELLTADQRLEGAVEWVATCTERLGRRLGRWVGVGVSLPGPITPQGELIRPAAFYEWEGTEVVTRLQAAFPVETTVHHDLDAAVIAEHRAGAAAEARSFVLAVLWHRVTAGLYVNGQLVRGATSSEGEPYHLSGLADADVADREWSNLHAVSDLEVRAAAGDAESLRSLERLADAAARQISMISLIIDPELVVLYGPATELRLLTGLVITRIREMADRETAPVVTSNLGPRSAAFGDALSALDAASSRLVGAQLTPSALRAIPIHQPEASQPVNLDLR